MGSIAAKSTAGQLGRAFMKDRKGSIALMFAVFLVPAIILMGLAIDTSRALSAASTASSALDAAALATARAMSQQELNSSEIDEFAERFFRANVEGEGKSRDADYGALSVSANPQTGEVTLSVSTRIETILAQFANISVLQMEREATAVYKQTDLEVSLMLDITGSMRGGKISDLRDAASDLIQRLIPEENPDGRARIALAPYASSVNAGPYKARAIEASTPPSGFTLAGFSGGSGDDCVVERDGAHAYTDTAPGPGSWAGTHPAAGYPLNRRYECPRNEIVPLTSNRNRLLDAVDDFDADGFTAGHIGAAWAWYMVSPNWSSVWPAESAPAPYGSNNLVKAVVMMTDGEFNTSYRNGRVNRTSDQQVRELCDSMNDRELIVFTVGFELRNATAIRTLEDCATEARYHYLAEDGEALRRAFNDIAVKLTQLRLTK